MSLLSGIFDESRGLFVRYRVAEEGNRTIAVRGADEFDSSQERRGTVTLLFVQVGDGWHLARGYDWPALSWGSEWPVTLDSMRLLAQTGSISIKNHKNQLVASWSIPKAAAQQLSVLLDQMEERGMLQS